MIGMRLSDKRQAGLAGDADFAVGEHHMQQLRAPVSSLYLEDLILYS